MEPTTFYPTHGDPFTTPGTDRLTDWLTPQNDHAVGFANSLDPGHDYGTDIGWALEYNAAPNLREDVPTCTGFAYEDPGHVASVPTPSTLAIGLVLAFVAFGGRSRR